MVLIISAKSLNMCKKTRVRKENNFCLDGFFFKTKFNTMYFMLNIFYLDLMENEINLKGV